MSSYVRRPRRSRRRSCAGSKKLSAPMGASRDREPGRRGGPAVPARRAAVARAGRARHLRVRPATACPGMGTGRMTGVSARVSRSPVAPAGGPGGSGGSGGSGRDRPGESRGGYSVCRQRCRRPHRGSARRGGSACGARPARAAGRPAGTGAGTRFVPSRRGDPGSAGGPHRAAPVGPPAARAAGAAGRPWWPVGRPGWSWRPGWWPVRQPAGRQPAPGAAARPAASRPPAG